MLACVTTDSDAIAAIRARLPELSRNDRSIATWLLDHADLAPFETADSLARKAGVSKAAVVRFGTRMGYSGYAEMHEAIQRGAQRQLAGEDLVPALDGHLLDRWLAACRGDLEATRRDLEPSVLDEVARILAAPEGRTFIFGQRKSAALAEYAFFLLNPLLQNIQPLHAGPATVADMLVGVGPNDRLLAITFRRYARLTFEVVDYVAQSGGTVILVTDDRFIPPAAHARHVLVGSPESPGPFASAVGGVFVIEALAAAVAEAVGGEARLEEAEELWDRFGPY
jgi:DNA-binding MurR/RpiR family transcriptional regulator